MIVMAALIASTGTFPVLIVVEYHAVHETMVSARLAIQRRASLPCVAIAVGGVDKIDVPCRGATYTRRG